MKSLGIEIKARRLKFRVWELKIKARGLQFRVWEPTFKPYLQGPKA